MYRYIFSVHSKRDCYVWWHLLWNLRLSANTECTISTSNMDGNPTTGNTCVRSVTRLLLKDEYFSELDKKVSDPMNGIKSYWVTLNKIINKKTFSNFLPLLENEAFVTNFQTKPDIFNDHFVEQCSLINNDSVLPNFVSRCGSSLSNMYLNRKPLNQGITRANHWRKNPENDTFIRSQERSRLGWLIYWSTWLKFVM